MRTKPPENLHDIIEQMAREDAGYAIAYALLKLATAQADLAFHVKYLGNGNAATQMGAIEAFGKHIGEKLDLIADALSGR